MIGGWIADTLLSKGLSVTTVRKIMQSIGFLGPAFFLTHLSHVKAPALAVLCMACNQGSDAFSVWPLLQSPRHWAPICWSIVGTIQYPLEC
ncbi:ascorbate transporter, chloroplastic-like isoform X2 [Camellia sinensis]|uniref:ascorbate transporter, chloroplastic-like isoform X2 n=1 Tax=Camellia sinensis TaxID=4442 RepID=UPI00103633C8|nr:ascorbate transporter, chloroplastic-like isoform X2 [Camellia sinensis]